MNRLSKTGENLGHLIIGNTVVIEKPIFLILLRYQITLTPFAFMVVNIAVIPPGGF